MNTLRHSIIWIAITAIVGVIGFGFGWKLQERETAKVMLAALYKDATTSTKSLDGIRKQNIAGVKELQLFLLETTQTDLDRLLSEFPHLRTVREAQDALALLRSIDEQR